MITILYLAAGLAVFAATTALAGEAPRLTGGGENASVVYGLGDLGNRLGGGRIIAENDVERGFRVTYLEAPPVTGVGVPTLIGGGENTTVAYAPTAPAASAGVMASVR